MPIASAPECRTCAFSRSTTRAPASAAVIAAMVPAVPPPTTRTSQLELEALGGGGICWIAGRRQRGPRGRADRGEGLGGARWASTIGGTSGRPDAPRRGRSMRCTETMPWRPSTTMRWPRNEGLVDVVGDEDDRAAGGLPGLDEQSLHRGAGLRVERAERLVHADDARARRRALERAARAAACLRTTDPGAGHGEPGEADAFEPHGGRRRRSARLTPWTASASSTLRRADRHGSSASSWNTRARSGAGARHRADHWRRELADGGRTSPAMARSRVDLPQPECPSTTRISPGVTSRSMPWTTGSPAYPRVNVAGLDGGGGGRRSWRS